MMEPLAIALRSSLEVEVIQIGTIKECLALYADDLTLFLSEPGPSLQVALAILNTFASYSGLKVNWTKSFILPLDSGPP